MGTKTKTINTLIENHIVNLADKIDRIADRLDYVGGDSVTRKMVAAGYALSWDSHEESFRFLMQLLDLYKDDIEGSLREYCFEIKLEYDSQFFRLQSILI
jgi:DNA-binding ferritin-like protein